MKEILHNGYVKIAPIVHDSFVSTESANYNEIGIVLAKDESITDIPIGSKVKFDRFLAFKLPVEGEVDKWEWYVKYSEVLSHVE